MAPSRPRLRDDLERGLEALDRGPHTPEELADATGISSEALEARIETLLDRGWVSRWEGGDETVLAMAWRGRYRFHRTRFQVTILASLAAGLAVAAGLAWWAAASRPAPPVAGPGAATSPWALPLALTAAVSLGAALLLRRARPT
jgi:hypothetical protein